MAPLNVAAIIVTRGDQDLTPVVTSLPEEWEVLIWDNSREDDLSVYGRYAAIARTDAELIYVQDDDCVVSNPAALVTAWQQWIVQLAFADQGVVCNMPQEFRHSFYEEHALVGFGACFHRDAPGRAFSRFAVDDDVPDIEIYGRGTVARVKSPLQTRYSRPVESEFFRRTCDIIFTALTPRVLVDVPKTDLPWAHYETRLWKQPGHVAERVRMLDLVRAIA